MKAKKPRAAKPGKRKVRGPYKKRAAKVQKVQRRTARSPALEAPGFRCGLYSDGSMDLERSGETFQMVEAEVRVLFAYLEKTLPEARA